MNLRPYQQQIIDESRELLQRHRAVVVTCATGSGKSVIQAAILKSLSDNNHKGYLLTHRYEIFRQLLRHLIRAGIEPGQIVSGQRMTSNKIHVAMVQTLYKKMKYLKPVWPDLILADEGHHYCSPTFASVINYIESTKTIAFTATPARTDGIGLNMAGFTAMIEGPQSADLIKAGYLTPMVLLSAESTKLFRDKKFKKKNGEYDKDELTLFANEKIILQDTVNVYKRYFNGAPCIVFCCSVSDCETVASAIRAEGYTCEAIHDKVPTEERIKRIEGLSTGEMQCICAYDIISEGVDVPILAGVIIRRLTASIINYLQWVGRALRLSPGKKQAIVVDQSGNVFQHGHPLEIRQWSLDGTCKRKDKDEIELKQCEYCGCWNLKSVKICEGCGNELTGSTVRPEKEKQIKIIDAPLCEIKAPDIPVGRTAIDMAEIMEIDQNQVDIEIIERMKTMLKNHEPDARERLEILCKAFNLSNTWLSKTWDLIKHEVEK